MKFLRLLLFFFNCTLFCMEQLPPRKVFGPQGEVLKTALVQILCDVGSAPKPARFIVGLWNTWGDVTPTVQKRVIKYWEMKQENKKLKQKQLDFKELQTYRQLCAQKGLKEGTMSSIAAYVAPNSALATPAIDDAFVLVKVENNIGALARLKQFETKLNNDVKTIIGSKIRELYKPLPLQPNGLTQIEQASYTYNKSIKFSKKEINGLKVVGATLILGGRDRTIRAWETKKEELLFEHALHQAPITALDANAEIIASGDTNGDIVVCSTKTGAILNIYNTQVPCITSLIIKGKEIVACNNTSQYIVINTELDQDQPAAIQIMPENNPDYASNLIYATSTDTFFVLSDDELSRLKPFADTITRKVTSVNLDEYPFMLARSLAYMNGMILTGGDGVRVWSVGKTHDLYWRASQHGLLAHSLQNIDHLTTVPNRDIIVCAANDASSSFALCHSPHLPFIKKQNPSPAGKITALACADDCYGTIYVGDEKGLVHVWQTVKKESLTPIEYALALTVSEKENQSEDCAIM